MGGIQRINGDFSPWGSPPEGSKARFVVQNQYRFEPLDAGSTMTILSDDPPGKNNKVDCPNTAW